VTIVGRVVGGWDHGGFDELDVLAEGHSPPKVGRDVSPGVFDLPVQAGLCHR
jgi:hypothetical protein